MLKAALYPAAAWPAMSPLNRRTRQLRANLSIDGARHVRPQRIACGIQPWDIGFASIVDRHKMHLDAGDPGADVVGHHGPVVDQVVNRKAIGLEVTGTGAQNHALGRNEHENTPTTE